MSETSAASGNNYPALPPGGEKVHENLPANETGSGGIAVLEPSNVLPPGVDPDTLPPGGAASEHDVLAAILNDRQKVTWKLEVGDPVRGSATEEGDTGTVMTGDGRFAGGTTSRRALPGPRAREEIKDDDDGSGTPATEGDPGDPGGPGGGGEYAPVTPESNVEGPIITNERVREIAEQLMPQDVFDKLARQLLTNGDLQAYNMMARLNPEQQAQVNTMVWSLIAEHFDRPDVNVSERILESLMHRTNHNAPIEEQRIEAYAQQMFIGHQELAAGLEFDGIEQIGSSQIPLYTNHKGERIEKIWAYLATRITDVDAVRRSAEDNREFAARLLNTFYAVKPQKEGDKWHLRPLRNVRFFDDEGYVNPAFEFDDEEVKFLLNPTFEPAHYEYARNGRDRTWVEDRVLQPDYGFGDAASWYQVTRTNLLAFARRGGFEIHHASLGQRWLRGDRSGHDEGEHFINGLMAKIDRVVLGHVNLTPQELAILRQQREALGQGGSADPVNVAWAQHRARVQQHLDETVGQINEDDIVVSQDHDRQSAQQSWEVLNSAHESQLEAMNDAHRRAMEEMDDAIGQEITALNDSVAALPLGDPEIIRVGSEIRTRQRTRQRRVWGAGAAAFRDARSTLNRGARRDWRARHDAAENSRRAARAAA